MSPTALSAREIAETVFRVEQQLDLTLPSWVEGDVHWWPLYRVFLYRELFLHQASVAGKNGPRNWSSFFHRNRSERRGGRATVAFLSDGISTATIAGRTIDRFCGPLANSMKSRGIASEVFDRGSLDWRSLSPAAPTQWVAPTVFRKKAVAMIRAHCVTSGRHSDCCKQLSDAMRELGSDGVRLDPRRMSALAAAVLSLSDWFKSLIETRSVSHFLIVNYYDVAGFAACLASSRAGVVSVDIQHGVGGRWHPAYAGWTKVPSDGYALLPRYFWTWTPLDAAVIGKWTIGASGPHKAIVGGNPYLAAWRTGTISADSTDLKCFEDLREAANGRPIALVTLQPDLATGDAIAPLIAVLEQHPRVAWWFRLHPTASGDRPLVLEMLRRLRVQCWDVDAATRLPLPLLLSGSSIHVTHSSSAVIESEAMTVPSIVWSEYGAQLFEEELQRGAAYFAADTDSFIELLLSAPGSIKTYDEGSSFLDTALDDLFGTSK
jgi:hypothetical protein